MSRILLFQNTQTSFFILSLETSGQASDPIHDVLNQREIALHLNLSQGRRIPLGNVHQLVENDRFLSSQYSTELSGDCQPDFSSMHWQPFSQPGNTSPIRQRQMNTRNMIDEVNDDFYVKLPSSPPMHPEVESKQGIASIPSFLLESMKEDISYSSIRLPDHIQQRLSLRNTPTLKCK